MLIAVFVAIFLVGILYYVIGISETLLLREKAQDAADAAVLSSAVMHARAMNVIVFINIIMAAVLSVLVTVKLLETLAIIGIGIAVASAWYSAGVSLSAVPPLNSLRSEMQLLYSDLKDPVYNALKALHDAADAVREFTPAAAVALTVADIEANATPPDTHGVAFPTRNDLPVESDSFSNLCGRAATVPVKIAEYTLKPLHLDWLMKPLESPMNELASSLSSWFCGEGDGGSPPNRQQSIDRFYPRTQTAVDCEKQSTGEVKADKEEANRTCAKSQEEEDAAKADETTGNCQSGHDCSLDGPYDNHVVMAREQCDPSISPSPFKYYYQTRAGQVQYIYKAVTRTWVRQQPEPPKKPVREQSDSPPCGSAETHPTVAEGYQKTVREHNDVSEVIPVCSNEKAPRSFTSPKDGSTETVKFVEVLHILGCARHETKTIDLHDAQRVEKSGSDKAPMRVQLQTGDGKSINLGDENFQLRAVLYTAVPSSVPEKVMQLALWNKSVPENPLPLALQGLRNFSLAQAEYFYDGADARSEWMWNMNWHARFRRVRVPEGDASNNVNEHCGKISGACSFLGQFKSLQKLVVH